MSDSLKSVPVEDELFFQVSMVGIQREDSKKSIKRHWAVVDNDRDRVFSVITRKYLKVPENMPRTSLHARGWPQLGSHLKKPGEQCTKALGDNADALVNAASDYASHEC